tara:strand:- start:2308 stop:3021 length:714 start_codon:yes stop_codon:yes gene_type:complete
MSEIWVTSVYNQAGDGSPNFPNGLTGTAATFTGPVSVGGTLTYEDVTNIDSVGVITARAGVKVTAGGVDVTAGGVDVTAGGINIGAGGINAVGVVTATSISATSYSGDGSGLTGMASTDKVATTTLNVSGISTFAGTIVTDATAMGANSVDCSTGNFFTKTITGATTLTFDSVPAGVYSFTMEVTLNGSNAITWPASVKWNADTAPTITDGKTQLFMFITNNGGTRWRGSALVDYVN